MLEFTRDGASGGPNTIVWTENEKKTCTQISMLTVIGGFSVRCLKPLHSSMTNSEVGIKLINSTHNSIGRCFLEALIRK